MISHSNTHLLPKTETWLVHPSMSICDEDDDNGDELQVQLKVLSIQTETKRRPVGISGGEETVEFPVVENIIEDIVDPVVKMDTVTQSIESVEKIVSSTGGPIITENPDGSIVATSSSSVSEVHLQF